MILLGTLHSSVYCSVIKCNNEHTPRACVLLKSVTMNTLRACVLLKSVTMNTLRVYCVFVYNEHTPRVLCICLQCL